MHFRFRGNNVQVVRTGRDAATGKAKSSPIGSINRSTLKISDKLRQACTPEELREIEGWVTHYEATARLKREHAARTLAQQMATASQWLQSSGAAADPLVAADILQAWNGLRKALASKA